MCLIVKKGTRKKIAKNDIKVYKIFCKITTQQDFAMSFLNEFKYEFDNLYKTEIVKSEYNSATTKVWDMDELISLNSLFKVNWRLNTDKIDIYTEGFHSSLYKDRLLINVYKYSVLRCTLPKGTEYYRSKTGLIVSNQIIVHREEQSFNIFLTPDLPHISDNVNMW